MEIFDLDIQSHLGLKRSKSVKNGLVHTISFEGLKPGLPNLPIRCIMGRSRLGFYRWNLTLSFNVIWGPNGPNRLEMGLSDQQLLKD